MKSNCRFFYLPKLIHLVLANYIFYNYFLTKIEFNLHCKLKFLDDYVLLCYITLKENLF